MRFQSLIEAIEQNPDLGAFSTENKIKGGGHTHNIPFVLKPSQQLIANLGNFSEKHHPTPLTPKGQIKTSGNTDKTVSSFAPRQLHSEVLISGEHIDRLFKSGKIYLDTNTFPSAEYYSRVLTEGLTTKTSLTSENKGGSWETLATGLCHAQEIDLLVDSVVSKHGRAHTTVLPDGTIINKDLPAIILLSNPLINLKHHETLLKDHAEQNKRLTAMYKNLFDAATREGCKYVLMSTSGITNHEKRHFAALISAAKDFPKLRIIYNAANHENDFKEALHAAKKTTNIGLTTKNIVFIAAELRAHNRPCAIHNPSTSNALYGLADIGNGWENSFDKSLPAYLGTVTTARLGSYGINPQAFSNIVARDLSMKAEDLTAQPSAPVVPEPVPVSTTVPEAVSEPAPEVEVVAAPVPAPTLPTEHIDEAPKPTATEQPPIPVMPRKSSSPDFFPPPAVNVPVLEPLPAPIEHSSLTDEQMAEIHSAINRLHREIASYWPYPNKDVKQIKEKALNTLIAYSFTMSVSGAIAKVKEEFPRATEGMMSTRTADLFRKLEGADVSESCCL